MSMKKKIIPLGDRVLIKLTEDKSSERKTKSGLYLPETAAKQDSNKYGTVTAVGKGRIDEKGAIILMSVKEGDEVIFTSWSDGKITMDEEDYFLVNESSILGIIK